MRKIVVWFEQGGGLAVESQTNFIIKTAKKINYIEWTNCNYTDIEAIVGTTSRITTIYCTKNGIIVRLVQVAAASPRTLTSITLCGDFDTDQLSITSEGLTTPYRGRLEIRNEYGVLITDNGVPWVDGTYPPDAKNRAGLAGLHAAPAVINPKLENALMGDETNEERVQE